MTRTPFAGRIKRRFPAGASTALLAIFPGAGAHAEGVQAGTVIVNTATATFDNGGSASTVTSNTVSVKVDEILDVTVVSRESAPVAIGIGEQPLAFTVTNIGNGPEAFALTGVTAIGGDDFDPTLIRLVIDSNNNGIYDPATDTVVTTGGATPTLDPDAQVTVFAISTAPGGLIDQKRGKLRLDARALTGTGTPGTSFAGLGLGGGAAVVGATGADADAEATLIAARVSVSLIKSAAMVDPYGGATAVPGTLITYTIASTVSGTGSAPGLRIADVIPVGTDYEPGSLRLENNVLTDAADGDAGQGSASGIDVAVGDQPAGSTRTVRFTVKIK
ncbi:hypothetical protein COC42_12120 [Sphingomonas spermidinifaciens]|uniref:DUF11 domain-containing protein n=1 Tax=Sphingomonas spermidinifaciens TaxID=1141889 RepID=A0A2A4B182_9SPHN|nr:hypothetical protein [Sphingomonas spermidinifaciens]PCD02201.1 hypothetical protein COC42_12120 [Sphingomonas spermidinifaciens]